MFQEEGSCAQDRQQMKVRVKDGTVWTPSTPMWTEAGATCGWLSLFQTPDPASQVPLDKEETSCLTLIVNN